MRKQKREEKVWILKFWILTGVSMPAYHILRSRKWWSMYLIKIQFVTLPLAYDTVKGNKDCYITRGGGRISTNFPLNGSNIKTTSKLIRTRGRVVQVGNDIQGRCGPCSLYWVLQVTWACLSCYIGLYWFLQRVVHLVEAESNGKGWGQCGVVWPEYRRASSQPCTAMRTFYSATEQKWTLAPLLRW